MSSLLVQCVAPPSLSAGRHNNQGFPAGSNSNHSLILCRNKDLKNCEHFLSSIYEIFWEGNCAKYTKSLAEKELNCVGTVINIKKTERGGGCFAMGGGGGEGVNKLVRRFSWTEGKRR